MSHVDGVDDGVGYGVRGRSNRGGHGVQGTSDIFHGVYGYSYSNVGVHGSSNNSAGVSGTSYSIDSPGVYGYSDNNAGVYGYSNSIDSPGVYGYSSNSAGVSGRSIDSPGVAGYSDNNIGVSGRSLNGLGVWGFSLDGYGVSGFGYNNRGVYGISRNGEGVYGSSENNAGVWGSSPNSIGVRGSSVNGLGLGGESENGLGVFGASSNNAGVVGWSRTGYAAYLDGRVYIRGPLRKPGGSFKIDHPLDPANKYLSHSFVESPDMKNVYDGVVMLDGKGEAEIELPDWFGALNKDFRYQLTAIGAPGPNLYIAEEISEATMNYTSSSSSNNNNNSRFKIAGGTSGMKVSWQVTGIRKDPWANANRIEVEEDKPDKERGYYLHPDLYSQPEDKGIGHLLFPKDKRREEVLARAAHKREQAQ